MGDSDADMVAKVAGGNRGGLDALKTDKPPTWDGKKTSYTAWWYLMYPFLLLCRLGPTLRGSNRGLKDSKDDSERTTYEMLNLYLWRLLVRSISNDTAAGQALHLQIQDDFKRDLDGYELTRYIEAYSHWVT